MWERVLLANTALLAFIAAPATYVQVALSLKTVDLGGPGTYINVASRCISANQTPAAIFFCRIAKVAWTGYNINLYCSPSKLGLNQAKARSIASQAYKLTVPAQTGALTHNLSITIAIVYLLI